MNKNKSKKQTSGRRSPATRCNHQSEVLNSSSLGAVSPTTADNYMKVNMAKRYTNVGNTDSVHESEDHSLRDKGCAIERKNDIRIRA